MPLRSAFIAHLRRAAIIGAVGGALLSLYDATNTVWLGDISSFIAGDLVRLLLVPLLLYVLFGVLLMATVGTLFFFLYRANELPDTPLAHRTFQLGLFTFAASLYLLIDALNAPAAPKPAATYWLILVLSLLLAGGAAFASLLLERAVPRRGIRALVLLAPIVLFVGLATWDVARSGRLPKDFFTLSRTPKQVSRTADNTGGEAANRPNILVLILDSARADHFSFMGYDRDTTPVVDSLANEGAVYERAVSVAPWTLPSHASMLTSLHVGKTGADGPWPWLADSFTTLPEVLQRNGYATLGYSNNDNFGPKPNLTQGFDQFTLFTPNGTSLQGQLLLARTIRSALFALKVKGNFLGLVSLYRFLSSDNLEPDYGAARTVAAVNQGIDKALTEQKPFFVMANMMEVHDPYGDSPDGGRYLGEVPGAGSLASARAREELLTDDFNAYVAGAETLTSDDAALVTALYDGDLHYLDRKVGDIIAHLDNRGIKDDTLILVTSDHGENLGDQGMLKHIYDIHYSLTHVPLVLRLPGTFTAGSRVSAAVQTIDLFPTILDVAGITDFDRSALQGLSLLGTEKHRFALVEADFTNDTFTRTRFIMPNYPSTDERRFTRTWRAVIEGDYEYVETPLGRSLFNIKEDPRELDNLAERDPARVKRLRQLLFDYMEKNPEYLNSLTQP